MSSKLDETLELISEAELAEFRNVKVDHLRNERSQGRGPPYVKVGNSVKYPLGALRKWLAEHTVRPGTAMTLSEGRQRA
ncbi:MAG TPA: hypothetical protein VMU40_02520 [Steroidobacteraceae bacterium]|nr:hypothetical protein [Steroidobacteraceae bacterium]